MRKIQLLIAAKGISRYRLAKDTRVPYTTLTQILDGRTKDPQVGALGAIADYFGTSIDWLIERR